MGGPTRARGEGRRLCNRSVVTASSTHVTASFLFLLALLFAFFVQIPIEQVLCSNHNK